MMHDSKQAMALEAARRHASGARRRHRSLCNDVLEAKTGGEATGKPWWQAAVVERSDYAREEFDGADGRALATECEAVKVCRRQRSGRN